MRDIEIRFPAGEVELVGTIAVGTAPGGPAALLLSGSGPIDRDSNTRRMPIDVMRRLAGHLADAGVTTLRYDKRGVGESGGDYLSTGFHDNIADARAALDALRARPEVDPRRIVVIGHSEGAMAATVLAVDEELAGVVVLAGAAQRGRDILHWQATRVAATLPRPVRGMLRLLRQDVVRTQAKRLDRIEASSEDVLRIQLVRLNARWLREFMDFDPATALARAAVPVLALTGGKDIQVDPSDIGRMRELVTAPFEGHVIDDVSHLLRHAPGPASLRTYKKQARRPLDERVVRLTVEGTLAMASDAVGGAG